MTMKTISTSAIVNGKLPNDYEVEETLAVNKTARIKVENELRGMLIQKKGIESSLESYNIHVSRIKKIETFGKAVADLTMTPEAIKISIPEINFKTDPIIFDNNV